MTTETIIAYKATRPDGTDYRTGTMIYAPGTTLEIAADSTPKCDCGPGAHLGPCPPSVGPCGHGLHVSPTPRLTCRYIDRSKRGARARFFECHVQPEDVLARDDKKLRVRKLHVHREVPFEEIFPNLDTEGLRRRTEEVRTKTATWKQFPWLKPEERTDEEWIALLRPLLAQWHVALSPFLRESVSLPRRARIVRKLEDVHSADDAAAAAADADDAAAAAAAADDAAAFFARTSVLKQCAEIARKRYPHAPNLTP